MHMRDFRDTDWLNREQEVHPVLVSGISQFQFVHVHPPGSAAGLEGHGRHGAVGFGGATNKLVYRIKEAG